VFWPNRTEPKCGEEEPLQWLDLRLIRHLPALEKVLGRAKIDERKSLPHQGILSERGDMMDADPRDPFQVVPKAWVNVTRSQRGPSRKLSGARCRRDISSSSTTHSQHHNLSQIILLQCGITAGTEVRVYEITPQ